MTLSPTDTKLYDRQIRIFGCKTQEKLLNTSLQLMTPQPTSLHNSKIYYVAGEILKNFILLGIKDIKATSRALETLKLIVPDSFMLNTDIEVTDESQNVDIKVFIDEDTNETGFFICTECYRFGTQYSHDCIKQLGDQNNRIAMECLIGSIFVQEMVNMLAGSKFVSEYTLILQ